MASQITCKSTVCSKACSALLWRHNGCDCVSNHQPRDCLLNRLFRRRSKQTSKLRVTGLCAGNSPGTGEFTAQMASNAENVPIWWRHHESDIKGNTEAPQCWSCARGIHRWPLDQYCGKCVYVTCDVLMEIVCPKMAWYLVLRRQTTMLVICSQCFLKCCICFISVYFHFFFSTQV